MKNWEDIFKERLEGYESPLPEDGLERFKEALSGERVCRVRRSFSPVYWLSGIGVAAACLAAVFLFRTPEPPESVINVITGPPVANVTEIKEDAPARILSKVIKSETVSPEKELTDIAGDRPVPDEPSVKEEPEITDEPEVEDEPEEKEEPPVTGWPAPQTKSDTKSVKIKTGTMVAGVAGTGLLGAMAAFLSNSVSGDNTGRRAIDLANYHDALSVTNPDTHKGESTPDDDLTVNNEDDPRRFTLKYGMSAKVPMNDRLAITAGVSYSTDQCLWIPVRLDWTFASWESLDFYAGAGFEGSFDLLRPMKEGASLALTGAGGAQWNLHRRLGLYLEPVYSWNIHQRNGMFAVSTGLRINLGK